MAAHWPLGGEQPDYKLISSTIIPLGEPLDLGDGSREENGPEISTCFFDLWKVGKREMDFLRPLVKLFEWECSFPDSDFLRVGESWLLFILSRRSLNDESSIVSRFIVSSRGGSKKVKVLFYGPWKGSSLWDFKHLNVASKMATHKIWKRALQILKSELNRKSMDCIEHTLVYKVRRLFEPAFSIEQNEIDEEG